MQAAAVAAVAAVHDSDDDDSLYADGRIYCYDNDDGNK